MNSSKAPSFSIQALSNEHNALIQSIIDNKTKPPGALGKLEDTAYQLARVLGADNIILKKPTMVVFAADHGIAKEGVSIAPPEVTQQMVINMLSGGAGINCFCKSADMALLLVDAGILSTIDHPKLTQQSLGKGTDNFSQSKAMSVNTVLKGIQYGASVSSNLAEEGCNIVGFGEMGIGNTSSASAIMAEITQHPVDICVGAGTGISEQQLKNKTALIDNALQLHSETIQNSSSPQERIIATLSCLGGFEIVQMIGAMLGAAENNMVILVDGFIASVAALVAHALYPQSIDYMVFCHQSHERGHAQLLTHLKQSPLLDLNLRLGEGTGAALALPLIQAAAGFYNDMASFDSAQITPV